MKKFKNILITTIACVFVFILFFGVIYSSKDPFHNTTFIKYLNGVGNFFLSVVLSVFGLLSLGLPIVLPVLIYKGLSKNEGNKKAVKELGITYAIILGGLSILAIAGCLLRELH
jgi:hypothetical protein